MRCRKTRCILGRSTPSCVHSTEEKKSRVEGAVHCVVLCLYWPVVNPRKGVRVCVKAVVVEVDVKLISTNKVAHMQTHTRKQT